MKRTIGTTLLVIILSMALISALFCMTGCSGAGSEGNQSNENVAIGNTTGSEIKTVQSLLVNNVEFTFREVEISPASVSVSGSSPGDRTFTVSLNYSGSGDAQAALGALLKDGYLLVNEKLATIQTTGVGVDGKTAFVTLICSTSEDLEAAGLSIELVYGSEKLVCR